MANFTGIFLADIFGQIFKKAVRVEITPALVSYSLPSQCGGIKNRGTDFAALFRRSVIEYATDKKLSLLIHYLDLVSAFASLRSFVAFSQYRPSDAEVCRFLSDFQIPLIFSLTSLPRWTVMQPLTCFGSCPTL